MIKTIAEIISLSALFVTGILAYRHMDRFFRLVYIQGLVWIIFYLALFLLGLFPGSESSFVNNQWLVNIHMLLECLLLMAAAREQLSKRWQLCTMAILLFLFLLTALLQGLAKGFGHYLNYADVAGCLAITIIYSMVLYQVMHQALSYKRSSTVLLCGGLLLYFAGSVPYIALLHYIQDRNPYYNALLFDLISNSLAFFRYTLTALAFFYLYHKAISQKRVL